VGLSFFPTKSFFLKNSGEAIPLAFHSINELSHPP
jgi:hypothetical protein